VTTSRAAKAPAGNSKPLKLDLQYAGEQHLCMLQEKHNKQ
jgi:hypothetical protein